MGYFSKCCAKTHLPVVVESVGISRLNEVVALLPGGRKAQGSYDGYGRVGGVDLQKDWDRVKLILAEHYNGEAYDELGQSGDEMGQGYFMSRDFLHHCLRHGPFKNRAAYTRAFKKLANW
jgi:hypothetical protein